MLQADAGHGLLPALKSLPRISDRDFPLCHSHLYWSSISPIVVPQSFSLSISFYSISPATWWCPMGNEEQKNKWAAKPECNSGCYWCSMGFGWQTKKLGKVPCTAKERLCTWHWLSCLSRPPIYNTTSWTNLRCHTWELGWTWLFKLHKKGVLTLFHWKLGSVLWNMQCATPYFVFSLLPCTWSLQQFTKPSQPWHEGDLWI